MRLVVQRVKSGEVILKKDSNVIGKITNGLLVLVGIKEDDDEENVVRLAEKIMKLRIFSDENGKMNLSIKEVAGSLLIVSQFTLYADTSGGNRPSFIKAAKPEKAKKIYDFFIEYLKKSGVKVETGRFGEYMLIKTTLDGPVTIILEG